MGTALITGLEKTSTVGSTIGASAIFVAMLAVSADTIARYGLNRPLAGTSLVVEYCMAAMVFPYLAYTHIKTGHIKVELFISRLPSRAQGVLSILTSLLGVAIFSLITWKTFDWAWQAWTIRQYSGGVPAWPLYPAKFFVPFGSFMLCLQLAVDIFRQLARLLSHSKRNVGD